MFAMIYIVLKGLEMKIDLHMHSRYSDGSDNLEDILEKAKKKGIEVLSVVDHDTTVHFKELNRLSNKYDIKVISGVEISAYDFVRERKVHLLGYGYTGNLDNTIQINEMVSQRRHLHSLWQLEQLFLNNYLPSDTYVKTSKAGVLYKQHIMKALTDSDFESDEYQQLYKKLFKNDGICSGDIEYVDVYKAVAALKSDGCKVVVAHPGQLDSYDLIEDLVPYGLDGVEVYHPDHNNEDEKRARDLCDKYSLIMTGGSDYHGSYGKKVSVGKYLTPEDEWLKLINKE